MTDQSFEVRALPDGDTEPVGNIQQVCRHLLNSPDVAYVAGVLRWCLCRTEYQFYAPEFHPETGLRTRYEWTRIGGTT